MARRYVGSVLGVATEDIAIRHLERGVKFVLQHLTEKKVVYRQRIGSNDRTDHRQFVYSDEKLIQYEQSHEFTSLLNDLATKRMLKDLLE
jgi:hypothetical protein